ncbi:TrmH family RNA methyltransferase [Anoxybacterium hadale]|uniref:TrmH family RNA methyltransferase n=1 Tax=Anoxybacterium hadale TaxID=3408580 RepID=UPI003AFF73E0
MNVITSPDNRIYKGASQLKLKKHRDELSQYLIEGTNLIREALAEGGTIKTLILSEDYGRYRDATGNATSAEALAIAKEAEFEAERAGAPIIVLTSQLFRKLSDTETPQGIMAVVEKKKYSEAEFFGSASATNLIVLDRLQDPGNIGTILRTADAAGYMGAILLKGTADIYSPKIVRAAAGSLFRLPVFMTETPEQTIRLLRNYNKKMICTTLDTDHYYYDVNLAQDAAVIIGNEGNGVCNEFIKDSDLQVKIPMEGTIESLNAAVAAGILMYESVRQRHKNVL